MIHQSFINVLGQPKTIDKINALKLMVVFFEQLNNFKYSNILLEYLEHYGKV